jgi:hypothetical protein
VEPSSAVITKQLTWSRDLLARSGFFTQCAHGAIGNLTPNSVAFVAQESFEKGYNGGFVWRLVGRCVASYRIRVKHLMREWIPGGFPLIGDHPPLLSPLQMKPLVNLEITLCESYGCETTHCWRYSFTAGKLLLLSCESAWEIVTIDFQFALQHIVSCPPHIIYCGLHINLKEECIILCIWQISRSCYIKFIICENLHHCVKPN